jgi:MoaA/NifB/PqqE/SkfB family radical SAM enzyme
MVELLKTAALAVDFDTDNRQLKANGALSLTIRPILKKINQKLSEEKPAMIRMKDVVVTTWLPPIPSGPFRRLLLNEAKMAMNRPVPQTVSIEVTRKCGAACDHCLMREADSELNTEQLINVIDQALDMGTCIITFTEGDPLLREDIFHIIKHIDPEKAVVNLFTPGLEMTPEKAVNLKEAGLYNLIIGIYSPDPELHDTIRGLQGAHAKAVEAIRIALEAGLMVTMACHVKSGDIERIPQLYQFASDLGVQELSIWEGMPRMPRETLTQIDREKIIEIYRSINSNPNGPRLFANTYFEGQMLGCMAGRRWLHISVDGLVRACPYLKKAYGNILDRPLKEIWNEIRCSGEFNGFDRSCPAQKCYL